MAVLRAWSCLCMCECTMCHWHVARALPGSGCSALAPSYGGSSEGECMVIGTLSRWECKRRCSAMLHATACSRAPSSACQTLVTMGDYPLLQGLVSSCKFAPTTFTITLKYKHVVSCEYVAQLLTVAAGWNRKMTLMKMQAQRATVYCSFHCLL